MQRTPENGNALNGEAKIGSVRTLLYKFISTINFIVMDGFV